MKVNRTVTPVPPSCFFLLFRCCCGFVCPTKHIKAPTPCFFVQFAVASSVPQSTKKHSTVLLRANMFQHSVTVLCIRLPVPPLVVHIMLLLLFRYCCGFVCSTKHQKAPALLFRATSFQQSVTLLCVRLPSTLHPSCFWCFFVVAVVSSRPQNTNTVFFVHAFKRGHNWKTNIYYNVKGRKTKASSFRAIDISVFCWFRRIFFFFFIGIQSERMSVTNNIPSR